MGDIQGTAALGFEPRALLSEPDATEIRRFRRRMERTTGIPGARARRRLIADTALRAALSLGLAAPVVLVAVVPIAMANPWAQVGLVAILCVIVGGAVWFLLRPIARRWREHRPWRRWVRLSRFADDNGLDYRPEAAPSRGLMFQQGRDGRILDLLATPDGRFHIGTYTFVPTDSRSSSRDPAYSFMRIALDRPVPHLVLVSVARRGLTGYSSVGLAFAESQRVRLEGDFDRSFAVYAPDGYGADARYVLTPDFMARLADHASFYDLEFVDDALYVYSAAPWDLERLPTWAWARWFVELVGVAAVRRTARFSDDRSSAPGVTVAPQGRRLRLGVPLVAGCLAAAWFLMQVARILLEATQ